MLLKLSDTNKPDTKLKILAQLSNNIKQLQKNMPKNDNNMPFSYIDPQVILEFITKFPNDEIPERILQEATINIDYLEEVPIVNGLPFWERLDCEPLDYYKLFKLYRDQKKTDSTRSFENLKKQTGIQESYLHAIAGIYHWTQRTQTYDYYRKSQIEKAKQREIKELESNHLKAAKKIFDYCVDYFEKLATTNEIAKMPPSQIIDWWEKAAKLGRLSLGMPSDKPTNIENQSNKVIIEKQLNFSNNTQNNPNQKNLTINTDKKFLKEVLDILQTANALPKEIVAEQQVKDQTEQTQVIEVKANNPDNQNNPE
jgi:hypothetical protein